MYAYKCYKKGVIPVTPVTPIIKIPNDTRMNIPEILRSG